MECPYCRHTKSRVIKTERLTKEVVRCRKCVSCGNYWLTNETVMKELSKRENEPEQAKLFEEKGDHDI